MVTELNAIVTVTRWQRPPDSVTRVKGAWEQVGQAVSVACYAQAKSAGEVFARYVVQLKNPAVLLVNLADWTNFDIAPDGEGATVQVVWAGNAYYVAARPNVYESGLDTDHATVLLERGQYPH